VTKINKYNTHKSHKSLLSAVIEPIAATNEMRIMKVLLPHAHT